MEDIEIIHLGRKYIHEGAHLERLRKEKPEALGWCNMMVDSFGSIQLWSAGEYYYWKNGSTKREAALIEALQIIRDDLSDKSLATNGATTTIRKVRNFANDASLI
tara:strand:+ start:255 stop:569 length:315 start_codon:yes stop_codon:yes gene_type:complete